MCKPGSPRPTSICSCSKHPSRMPGVLGGRMPTDKMSGSALVPNGNQWRRSSGCPTAAFYLTTVLFPPKCVCLSLPLQHRKGTGPQNSSIPALAGVMDPGDPETAEFLLTVRERPSGLSLHCHVWEQNQQQSAHAPRFKCGPFITKVLAEGQGTWIGAAAGAVHSNTAV